MVSMAEAPAFILRLMFFVKPTPAVLKLQWVLLVFIIILGKKLLQGLCVRQVGFHIVEIEGHLTFL